MFLGIAGWRAGFRTVKPRFYAPLLPFLCLQSIFLPVEEDWKKTLRMTATIRTFATHFNTLGQNRFGLEIGECIKCQINLRPTHLCIVKKWIVVCVLCGWIERVLLIIGFLQTASSSDTQKSLHISVVRSSF